MTRRSRLIALAVLIAAATVGLPGVVISQSNRSPHAGGNSVKCTRKAASLATAASAVVISLAGLAAITWRIWWPWAIGAVGALAVTGSRLVLGVHWFSDVTFGLLAGAVWGVIVTLVLADVPWPFTLFDREPTPAVPANGP